MKTTEGCALIPNSAVSIYLQSMSESSNEYTRGLDLGIALLCSSHHAKELISQNGLELVYEILR